MADAALRWQGPIRGDNIADGSALVSVPCSGGIYLWRRLLSSPGDAIYDAEAFERWLDRECRQPFATGIARSVNGEVESALRPGTLKVDRVSFGGGELTAAKKVALGQHYATPEMRNELYGQLARAVERFGPVLYVGQTDAGDGLRTRLRQHTAEGSVLGARLGVLGIGFAAVGVWFAEIDEATEDQRTLLELALTHVLIAPLTIRPG